MTDTRFGNRRRWFLFLVAFTVFGPTVFHGLNYYHQRQQASTLPVFRLPVSGVDPRDLVRGRYAILQIDWRADRVDPACIPQEQNARAMRPDCRLCLMTAPEHNISLIPSGDAVQHCTVTMRARISRIQDDGTPVIHAFPHSVLRVYLDERIANQTDRMLRERKHDFSADIGFSGPDRKGAYTPQLQEFYINGTPYRQFLENAAKTPR